MVLPAQVQAERKRGPQQEMQTQQKNPCGISSSSALDLDIDEAKTIPALLDVVKPTKRFVKVDEKCRTA